MEGDIPLWLLLSLMVEFGFGQLFKWAEQKGCHAPTVVATNYLVLASILLIYLGSTGRLQLPLAAVAVGAVTGTVFISSMSMMTHVLRLLRVASVLTTFRLSIVVPVGLGMLLWTSPWPGSRSWGWGLPCWPCC